MARKKNDGLINALSLLPWWFNLGLAVVAPLILHPLAMRPVPVADPQHLEATLTGSLMHGVSSIGQYIAPVMLLLAALVSFIKKRRRRSLLDNLPRAKKALAGLTWQQFELLVGEAFRRQGFSVEETGGSGPDGGVDLLMRKDSEQFLVQCKQWRALKVGVTTVRELYGVIAAEGAVGGFVVTSGQFTLEAKRFAEGRNVRLIDGEDLARWVAESRRERTEPVGDAADSALTAGPMCPTCQAKMVRRTARRGANAGGQFWGCVEYPQCRGIRSV